MRLTVKLPELALAGVFIVSVAATAIAHGPDSQHMMEHRVAWAGNPNLKVGKITEKDADTIVAEIVTKDGSLVRKIDVDRHTGRMQAVQ